MRGWFDRPRTVVALVAAALAAMGAIAANADDGMAIWFIAAWIFAIEAVVAMAMVVLPSGGTWSLRRRNAAGIAAALAAVAAPILVLFTMARAACGCGNAANGYQLPMFFGFQAHDWVFVAGIAFPILMAIDAGNGLDRFRARRPL